MTLATVVPQVPAMNHTATHDELVAALKATVSDLEDCIAEFRLISGGARDNRNEEATLRRARAVLAKVAA